MTWTQERIASALHDLDTTTADEAFWGRMRREFELNQSGIAEIAVLSSPSEHRLSRVHSPVRTGSRVYWYAAAAAVLLVGGLYALAQRADQPSVAGPSPSDIVLTDPLALSLDALPRTAQPLPHSDYVVVDLNGLPEGWTATLNTAMGVMEGGAEGYRTDYTLLSPTGKQYPVIVIAGVTMPPRTGTAVDINGHPGLQTHLELSWDQEPGVYVQLMPTELGSPDAAAELTAAGRSLTFKSVSELPIVAIDPDAVQNSDAQFAGTLNGIHYAVKANTGPLRGVTVYAGSEPLAGIQEDRNSQPTDDPQTESRVNIQGVAGYGVIVFGYTEPATAALRASLADGTRIQVPVLRNPGETYVALPIPLGVEVVSLDFLDFAGATLRTATMPTLPAFFGHCCGSVVWTTDLEANPSTPLPDGAVLNGIVPECTSTDEIEYQCTIEAFPDVVMVDMTGYTAELVDDTFHVSGGCRSTSSDGTSYVCYVGQRAIDEGVVGSTRLGAGGLREYVAG